MSKPQMHDTLSKAFESAAILNEALNTVESDWDRATKTRLRKEVNGLKSMMSDVLEFEKDVTKDVIDGMETVIKCTEAKLDGKKVELPEETLYGQAA